MKILATFELIPSGPNQTSQVVYSKGRPGGENDSGGGDEVGGDSKGEGKGDSSGIEVSHPAKINTIRNVTSIICFLMTVPVTTL